MRATPFGVVDLSLAGSKPAGASTLILFDSSAIIGADRLDGTRGDGFRTNVGEDARSCVVLLRRADLVFADGRCVEVAVAEAWPHWDVLGLWPKAS